MNIFIKNKQSGEVKQFKDGILFKQFVQDLFLNEQPDDTKLSIPKSSDEAIEYIKENSLTWCIGHIVKPPFNLNYQQ